MRLLHHQGDYRDPELLLAASGAVKAGHFLRLFEIYRQIGARSAAVYQPVEAIDSPLSPQAPPEERIARLLRQVQLQRLMLNSVRREQDQLDANPHVQAWKAGTDAHFLEQVKQKLLFHIQQLDQQIALLKLGPIGLRELYLYQRSGLHYRLQEMRTFAEDVHSIDAAWHDSGEHAPHYCKPSLQHLTGRQACARLTDGISAIFLPEHCLISGPRGGPLQIPYAEDASVWKRVRVVAATQGHCRLLGLSDQGLYTLEWEREGNRLQMRREWPHRRVREIYHSRVTTEGELLTAGQAYLLVHPARTSSGPLQDWGDKHIPNPAGGLEHTKASDYAAASQLYAAGDAEGRIALYDLTHGRSAVYHVHNDSPTLTYHENTPGRQGRASEVSLLRFVPQHNLLFSSGMDMQLCLHKVTGTQLITLWRQTLDGNGQGLAFLPQSGLIAVAMPYRLSLWSWDEEEGNEISSWHAWDDILETVCCTPDGSRLVAGDWGGRLHRFAIEERGLQHRGGFQIAADSILAMAFVDDRHLLAVTEGRVMLMVDIEQQQVIATAPSHHLLVGNRRSLGLHHRVAGQDYFTVGPFNTASSVTKPSYLFPAEALCWNDGRLLYDFRDIVLESGAAGMA